jgi:hypothetical protein
MLINNFNMGKWCPFFTLCFKDYQKVGWNYQLPSLVKVVGVGTNKGTNMITLQNE